jgi:hypothetical protein
MKGLAADIHPMSLNGLNDYISLTTKKHQTKICKERYTQATKQSKPLGQRSQDSFDPVRLRVDLDTLFFQSPPTTKGKKMNIGKNKGTISQ